MKKPVMNQYDYINFDLFDYISNILSYEWAR